MLPLLLILPLLAAAPAAAQHKPFPVHDSRPAIVHGPYILAPTETSVTVVWVTDTPAHSKVLYGRNGQLDQVAEPQHHGLRPVGTIHSVRIDGLEPGARYQYRAVSTQVVKMKSYWPEKGLDVESPLYSFTPLDRRSNSTVFYAITDTHANLDRIAGLMELIDWNEAEFLVHLGDAFDADSAEVIWTRALDPLARALSHSKPLYWVRGNHDARGAAARDLVHHVPLPEGRYYYARDHGPAHLLFLDTGEDKPDETNVYSRLNAFDEYRQEELAWLRRHVATSHALASAPFRILFLHAPNWGWTNGRQQDWEDAARDARIDLSLSGHTHRFNYTPPADPATDRHRLVLAPDQAARIEMTPERLKITVLGPKKQKIVEFEVPRRQLQDASSPGSLIQ